MVHVRRGTLRRRKGRLERSGDISRPCSITFRTRGKGDEHPNSNQRAHILRRTRGKTARHRLRALDEFLCQREVALLSRDDASIFVDIGFGEFPWTTLESADRFRKHFESLEVVGVDNEPRRVEAAQRWSDAKTTFCFGGFDATPTPARLVRAMNVLRQYPEAEVETAHEAMGQRLVDGGLLVEGTCNKNGAVLTAHLLRKKHATLQRESLLMFTDFSRGFAPLLFRDQLPRDLRRRVVEGEAVHSFFQRWTLAWEDVRRVVSAPRDVFVASALKLAEELAGIDVDPWLLSRGYLLWSPADGVPKAGGA